MALIKHTECMREMEGALYPCLPPLSPPVLKPRLHLRVRHLEALGHGRPLGGGEVLLLVKALLQLADLDPAEGRARLLPLGRRPVLVGVADPPPRQGEWTCKRG